jgi:hypothetical protein
MPMGKYYHKNREMSTIFSKFFMQNREIATKGLTAAFF